MTCFAFVTGFLFCLYFLSYPRPCEGKIIEPPGGDSLLVESGLNVTIAWSFDDNISDVSFRSWSFTRGSSTTGDTLATISGDDEHKIKSTRFPFVISKPGTLILTKVDRRYHGTYKFTIIASKTLSSDVTVDVIVRPTAEVCSSPITVDEGENITCLCTGKGGNPPANVTWYDKDDKQIGVAGNEEQLLTLSNVDKTDSGTYKCVAQSYTLTDEESVQITVNCSFQRATIATTRTTNAPNVKNFTTEKSAVNESNCGTEWYIIVVTLVSGFIIGILFSYILWYSRRRFGHRKHQSKQETKTSKVDTIYHDLDLSKINSEGNYQSLKVNPAKNEAESENDSTYTGLSKVRDVENNYQSLT